MRQFVLDNPEMVDAAVEAIGRVLNEYPIAIVEQACIEVSEYLDKVIIGDDHA